MNNTFKLLCKERQEFINEMKLRCDLSLKTKEDYYFGMEKAFDDAFNQYARRNKKNYANDRQKLMSPIVDRMFLYFNSPNDNFENCFAECIELAKKILENNLYGIAQKFTNMSFKYLYCYSDADSFENKFENCHIPLDKYTIKWIKSLKNKNINKKLNNINNAWANIDKELAPGRFVVTNTETGVIETSETYFPSADWDKDELLAGDGSWVSRFASVKVRENSTNANRKIPKVVEFQTTGAATGNAPATLKNLQAELVSDNQRTNNGTRLVYNQKHDPNTLILATRDKWIKLHPDANDDSIEFEHTQSPLVTRLSYEIQSAPGIIASIAAPEIEENSSVNTANFKANVDGTEL
jgi:hypothetical protein